MIAQDPNIILFRRLKRQVIVFGKAQMAAFVGGIIDFIIMILCFEYLQMSLANAILIGGIIGALINFLICKYWAFDNQQKSDAFKQGLKFAVMSLSSIGLKIIMTSLIVYSIDFDYRISRLIGDGLVCFGFNYLLSRFWIFK